MQAVGELDEDNADVPDHGKEHFPQVLGLRVLFGRVVDMAQFGNALHNQQHVRAELALNDLRRQVGVLQRVVQQRRDHSIRVAVHFNENQGHGDRMGDIGLAGSTRLSLVLLCRDRIGAHDFFLIQLYVRVLQTLQELFSIIHGPPYPLTRRQSADLFRFALSALVFVLT